MAADPGDLTILTLLERGLARQQSWKCSCELSKDYYHTVLGKMEKSLGKPKPLKYTEKSTALLA